MSAGRLVAIAVDPSEYSEKAFDCEYKRRTHICLSCLKINIELIMHGHLFDIGFQVSLYRLPVHRSIKIGLQLHTITFRLCGAMLHALHTVEIRTKICA